MIRGTSLLLCLIIFAGALSARAAEQFGFDTWTTDDGLPQNGVRSIAQTPDGYLWFTTFDGLVRFDGLRFTTFNKSNTVGILNNRFSYLFADLDGTLYATTSEDGTLTIYRNGEFKSYTSDEVPGHYIQSIKRDSTGELKFLSEDNSRKSKTWYYLRSGQFVAADVMPPVNDAVEVVWVMLRGRERLAPARRAARKIRALLGAAIPRFDDGFPRERHLVHGAMREVHELLRVADREVDGVADVPRVRARGRGLRGDGIG